MQRSTLLINPVFPETVFSNQKSGEFGIERNAGSKRKTYTPIGIELGEGVTIITGANMGGKSVALKTITENLLLFHMGFL